MYEFFSSFLSESDSSSTYNSHDTNDDNPTTIQSSQNHQSLLICISFACISGLLRVIATMILAYPDYLMKQKQQQQQQQIIRNQQVQHQRCPQEQGLRTEDFIVINATLLTHPDNTIMINNNNDSSEEEEIESTNFQKKYYYYVGCHLILLAIAAFCSIISAIYGPVSIAIPIQTGSMLLCNCIIMNTILQMKRFTNVQIIGICIIFCSVLSLIDVGPTIQNNQNALKLITQNYIAIHWSLLISFIMFYTAIGTILYLSLDTTTSTTTNTVSSNNVNNWRIIIIIITEKILVFYPTSLIKNPTIILIIGCAMSNVVMATTSKTFASLTGIALMIAIIYYIIAIILGILFSVISSTVCDQSIFTPCTAVSLLLCNMITGIIIWEDYKVIYHTWIAYICCYIFMCCGVYLLNTGEEEVDHINNDQYSNYSYHRDELTIPRCNTDCCNKNVLTTTTTTTTIGSRFNDTNNSNNSNSSPSGRIITPSSPSNNDNNNNNNNQFIDVLLSPRTTSFHTYDTLTSCINNVHTLCGTGN